PGGASRRAPASASRELMHITVPHRPNGRAPLGRRWRGHEEAAAGIAPAAALELWRSAGAGHLVRAPLLVGNVARGPVGLLVELIARVGDLVLSAIGRVGELVVEGFLTIGTPPGFLRVRPGVAGRFLEIA